MKAVGIGIVLTLMLLGLLPFAFIARSRASQSDRLPVHLVMDMDKQPKAKAQRGTPLFEDGRFMRPEVNGTVAREDMELSAETLDDIHGTRPMTLAGDKETIQFSDPTQYAAVMMGRIRPAGMSDEDFAKVKLPSSDPEIAADTTAYVKRVPAVFKVDDEFLKRGQERFNIYCLPCHGESGYGDGPVSQRAEMLRTTPDAIGKWTKPQDLHEAKILTRTDGNIFNTITNGVRNMPAYDKQITVPDRWAIVSYVRALQRSQDAHPGDETK